MATKAAGAGDGSARMKSETARKAEAIKEIHQLKIKIQNMEREKLSHIYNKRGDFYVQHFAEMEETEQKLEKDRIAEKKKVVQQLQKIKSMVQKFQRELQNVKPTPEFVEKLKVTMEDTEALISQFKDQQRLVYEELVREERLAEQEIMALEKRIEMWASQPAVLQMDSARTKPPASITSHRDVTKDLPPEVAAFERFVQQSGGPRGGWDEYDHGTFLKFRNRHKGKPSFLSDVKGYLPTKTPREVDDHEAWYAHYLQLNEKKKEAIQKWKQKKEVEKNEVISDEESDSDEEEKLRQQKRGEILQQERNQRRAQLNAWRVEKELLRAEDEERKLRQQLEKAQKQEKERQRQMEQREEVEQYRQQREEEERQRLAEEAIRQQVEEEERRKIAGIYISKFQQRDRARVSEKVTQKKQKEEEEALRKKKLEQLAKQVEVNVARDPTRLYKLTEGWKERKKNPGPTGGGQVYHIPHRAVPSWRQT